jgi:hypothetical protein
LSGTQFSTLNSAGINDPEGPKKYNNNTESSGAVGPIPPHLREVYDTSCGSLDESQRTQLVQLPIEFQDVFAKSEFDLDNFTDVEHVIDTMDARPVKQRMRCMPACFAGKKETHLLKMLDEGSYKTISDWASAPVLICKLDCSERYCIDYRKLNEVTVIDVYPLSLVDDCMDTVGSWQCLFSKLDANSAYFQLKLQENRKKTVFITRYGLFEHVHMGFGLCGANATFARVMNLVFRGLILKTVLAFLDDIIMLGCSFEDHLSNLREALSRFRRLKPKECIFFQQEVEFLG